MADDSEAKKKTLYTIKLEPEHMDKLREWCDRQLWAFYEVAHAKFACKGDKVNVVAYNSGKLVVQGKKTEEFVQYVLEAEITGDPKMGYEEVHHPEWFEHHGGLDESGKGDLFGPLVSACVIGDGDMARQWREMGIQDSKRITSDKAILDFDRGIRKTKGAVVEVMRAGMAKYNQLYDKFGRNLNSLLAWMHAKALENALAKNQAPWVMVDQFSKQPLVQRAYKGGHTVDIRMQTKAEADPIVAAASICARAEYIRQMNALSEKYGEKLLRGASAKVKQQAREIIEKHGPEALGDYAKLHFRTAYEVLGLPVPEKTVWKKR